MQGENLEAVFGRQVGIPAANLGLSRPKKGEITLSPGRSGSARARESAEKVVTRQRRAIYLSRSPEPPNIDRTGRGRDRASNFCPDEDRPARSLLRESEPRDAAASSRRADDADKDTLCPN